MMMELVMGMGFRQKNVLILIVASFLVTIGSFVVNPTVYGYTGEGNPTSGTTTSCSGFINGFQYLCGKPGGSGGGGASWHIYRVSELNTDKLHYIANILDNGGVTADNVRNNCVREGADWVAVYGWEGSPAWNNYNILTGPANRTGPIKSAQYNNYQVMVWDGEPRAYAATGLGKLKNVIANDQLNRKSGNKFVFDNRRITAIAAKQLYYRGKKTYNIPDSVGYFCFNSGTKFQGQARAFGGSTRSDADVRSTSGWQDKVNTINTAVKAKKDPLEITCSDSSGCDVLFDFGLRRMQSGSTRTDYTIYRQLVSTEDSTKTVDKVPKEVKRVSSNDNYALSDASDTAASKVVYDKVEKMKPGDKICYFMKFGIDSGNDEHSFVEACAKVVSPPQTPSSFVGRIRIAQGIDFAAHGPDSTTGFVNHDAESEPLDLECPMKDGCRVTFSLDLAKNKEEMSGITSYTIYKYVNGVQVGADSDKIQLLNGTNHKKKSGSLVGGTLNPRYRKAGSGSASVYWDNVRMRPGDVVCYKMRFKTDPDQKTENAEVTGCARATGSANTTLDVKVKNNALDEEYDDEATYAKPKDTLSFKTTYNPLAQEAADTKPRKIRIDDVTEVDNGGDSNATARTLFGRNGIGLLGWNNGFVIDRDGFSSMPLGKKHEIYSYKDFIGSSEERIVYDDFTVNKANVGEELYVSAAINPSGNGSVLDGDIWTVPAEVSFTVENDGIQSVGVGSISTKMDPDHAMAVIPYNFNNDVCILERKSGKCVGDDSDEILSAGETEKIIYQVSVKTKENSLTTKDPEKEKYATIVRNAKVRAIAYTPGDGVSADLGFDGWSGSEEEFCSKYAGFSGSTNCGIVGGQDGMTFNEHGITSGYDESPKSVNVDVPDVDAGSRICVAMAVWPANSGDDSSINTNGSETWQISRSKCFTIAKKPSFQVWGGEIYSAGGVNTSLAKKTALAGYSLGIKESGAKESRTFGSWGELAVVSNGKISGLASGAGLGYAGRDGNTLWPNPTFAGGTSNKTSDYQGGGNNDNINDRDSGGGVDISSFCSFSTLTFPNGGCNSSSSSGGSGSGSFDFSMDDFISKNAETVQLVKLTGNSIDGIADFQSWDDDGDGNPDGKHTTVVYQSDSDDIEISGDITYSDAKYEKLQDVPKIIIYAKKNINVHCGVSRIDAILIAEDGNINTCSDSGDDNLKVRSNQLVVNGVTASQTLTLKRTYGAATGANSIIPAEIVNYDSSLYLWGKSQSSSDETIGTGRIKAAYIQELSPRY